VTLGAVSRTATSSLAEPLLVAARAGMPADFSTRVDVLEAGEKSSVYRLSWQVPRPGSCIVKRCSDGGRERTFYRDLAPRLSVSMLRCFGSHEDEDGSAWLVLEDAGDHEPSMESPRSRARLTEWATSLHVRSASLAHESIPDGGPEHFRRRLDVAMACLASRLETEHDRGDREILERCLERCEQLVELWPSFERVCAHFPSTVVHGDLVEENLRLRTGPDGPALVALDWEKVGWGVPAVDLVRVDPELYWSKAHGWLGGTRDEFERLLLVGRIFRVLVHRWTEKSIDKAERAEVRLGRLIAAAAEA
jgi:aminoglycoside phosphotransferase (APT) family kinase protein